MREKTKSSVILQKSRDLIQAIPLMVQSSTVWTFDVYSPFIIASSNYLILRLFWRQISSRR